MLGHIRNPDQQQEGSTLGQGTGVTETRFAQVSRKERGGA